MATPLDIAKIVNMLDAGYPNWLNRKTEEQIEMVNEVYFQLLKHFDTDLLKNSALKCMSKKENREFAPSAAALRCQVIDILREVQGIPDELQAWDEVVRMPSDMKRTRLTGESENNIPVIEVVELQWSHPVVGDVARMLGFPNFPKIKKGAFENEFGDRAHFFNQYNARVESYLEKITEHPEITNYIETQRALALPVGDPIKKLASKLEVK